MQRWSAGSATGIFTEPERPGQLQWNEGEGDGRRGGWKGSRWSALARLWVLEGFEFYSKYDGKPWVREIPGEFWHDLTHILKDSDSGALRCGEKS